MPCCALRAPFRAPSDLISARPSTVRSSLDLGAGVLILWYGGWITMQPDGAISVGNLITYQMYYGMMNNSIQALSNILNSFTRAAGAAERVLHVIDLNPDIDPNAGAPVDVAVRKWDLRFDNVHFSYQMRPASKVSGLATASAPLIRSLPFARSSHLSLPFSA